MNIYSAMMFNMDSMIILVGVLLSVAFFTLMERKVMGLAHYRKGPSKLIVSGVSQPMADAMKLLTKETMKFSFTKVSMFSMGPTMALLIMMTLWVWFESSFTVISSSMKMIMIFAMMGLGGYSMLLMSWGSNSKYSILGGHRAVAQMVSYEVCLFMVFLVVAFVWKSYTSPLMSEIQQGLWTSLALTPLFMVWVLLCLAETNRTPFDTAEGESEIVSGFNIEYGGGMFALIFISEYGMIMILSYLTSMFFLGASVVVLKMVFIMFIFVLARCSFPRVRYDNLMMLAWKMALPYSILMVTVSMIFG